MEHYDPEERTLGPGLPWPPRTYLPPLKRCSGNHWAPIEDFARRTSSKDGRQNYCRACHKRLATEYKYRKALGQLEEQGIAYRTDDGKWGMTAYGRSLRETSAGWADPTTGKILVR